MRSRAIRDAAGLLVTALALMACEEQRTRGILPTGPTTADSIVVESAVLETVTEATDDGWVAWKECHVRGTLRNDGTRDRSVTLRFQAFDPRDARIGVARALHNVVPAGGRTAYRAAFGVEVFGTMWSSNWGSCDRVHRFEVTAIEIEPA